jgi:hypothetical protein
MKVRKTVNSKHQFKMTSVETDKGLKMAIFWDVALCGLVGTD